MKYLSQKKTPGDSLIVNVASTLCLDADPPYLPIFSATQHAIAGLTKSLGVSVSLHTAGKIYPCDAWSPAADFCPVYRTHCISRIPVSGWLGCVLDQPVPTCLSAIRTKLLCLSFRSTPIWSCLKKCRSEFRFRLGISLAINVCCCLVGYWKISLCKKSVKVACAGVKMNPESH